MKREMYWLANHIHAQEKVWEAEPLQDAEQKKYQIGVLSRIRKEERMAKQRRRTSTAVAAALCLAVLAGTTFLFQNEVHAAMERISWSLSAALGLEGDLVQYKEVVNTSVSDKGYVVTLQEAVATEGKLVVNYTIQREDEAPMERIPTAFGMLKVNGKSVMGGSSGSGGFLDESQKIAGTEMAYDADGVDFSGKTVVELKFTEISDETVSVKGKWNFKFTADGSELLADTLRLALADVFTLPNGETVTLDEFSTNELEQRISFHTSAKMAGSYDLKLIAEDDRGGTAEFYVSRMRNDGIYKGYMLNSEYLEDGRISADAGKVTVTVYAVEMPEGGGRIGDDYVQLGESAEWDLTQLKAD